MDLEHAVSGAVAFLLGSRQRGGWWRDFDTLAGYSDEWVTGYVASALARLELSQAKTAAHRAWTLLKWRRWWSGGWGFNRLVPSDADSTAWALRLAHGLGRRESRRAIRGQRYLRAHLRSDGGIATYATDGPIRWFTRVQPSFSFRGWCSSHTCVSAAAALVADDDTRGRIVSYLRAAQKPDGHWVGYWWADHGYATALAVDVLRRSADRDDAQRVERAASWAEIRMGAEGGPMSPISENASPFGTACLIRTLLEVDSDAAAEHARVGTEWLLENQRPDGSWAPSAVLRIPPPDVTDPDGYRAWVMGGRGGGSLQVDRGAVFTTATVVDALRSVQRCAELQDVFA